jgi:hypothetical protein
VRPSSRFIRSGLALVGAVVLVVSSGLPRAGADTYPQATVNSPADGSTVGGTVTIDATGATDPAGTDVPSTLEFHVDGSDQFDFACDGTSTSCHGTYDWDTTGLSGQHSISVVVDTANGATAESSPVTVTVNNPGPSVVINSPSDGDTVQHVVTIDATGSTDPNQSDAPDNLNFAIDGSGQAGTNCDAASTTCHGVYRWNTYGLSGRHTITVTLYTVNGNQAEASVSVTVKPAKALDLEPFLGIAGKPIRVRGFVGVLGTSKGLSGEKVTIHADPVFGSSVTKTVTSGAGGVFHVRLTLPTKAKLRVSTPDTDTYAGSSLRTLAQVQANLRCHVTKPVVPPHVKDLLVCTAVHLPDGTPGSLSYNDGGGWYNLGKIYRAHNRRLAVPFYGYRRAALRVRMDVGGSRVYAGGYGPAVAVRVT